MSLSNDIIKPPKELTCICGKCDLSYVRTTKLKQALKELIKELDRLEFPYLKIFKETKLKKIFGEELLEEEE